MKVFACLLLAVLATASALSAFMDEVKTASRHPDKPLGETLPTPMGISAIPSELLYFPGEEDHFGGDELESKPWRCRCDTLRDLEEKVDELSPIAGLPVPVTESPRPPLEVTRYRGLVVPAELVSEDDLKRLQKCSCRKLRKLQDRVAELEAMIAEQRAELR